MFKPISLHDAPLKEGRLPLAITSPRELSAKRAQRTRQIVLVVLVLLLLRTISVLYWSPSNDLSAGAPETTGTLDPSVPRSPRPTTPTSQQDTKTFPKLNLDGQDASEDADPPALSLEHFAHHGQVPLNGKAKTGVKDQNKFSSRSGFDQALLNIINLLPSELEMRGLLRPIELTGESRLRELGMLARKYKKYLEAWEELHVVTDSEGGTHVRDDVIQYLRYHASLRSASADDDDDASDEHNDLVGRIHAYEDFRRLLGHLNELLFPFTAPYFPDHMTLRSHLKKGGRGIALTAGNDQVSYLLTQIPILRQLGCDLPIEVMYVGDGDLNRDSRQDLEDLDGVMTRDISAMVHPVGWDIGSWAAKPFAILLSSFREVIFIDADSFFFVNPEVMFEYPEYAKTGALFFRDRLIMPENKKSWLQSVLPQPVSRNVKQSRLWTGESGHQQESGVLVVDTYRHFLAMLFVTRMNGPDRDGDRANGKLGVYDMVYGESLLPVSFPSPFDDEVDETNGANEKATRRRSGSASSSSATQTTSSTRATPASSASSSPSCRSPPRTRSRSGRTRRATIPTAQTKTSKTSSSRSSRSRPPRPATAPSLPRPRRPTPSSRGGPGTRSARRSCCTSTCRGTRSGSTAAWCATSLWTAASGSLAPGTRTWPSRATCGSPARGSWARPTCAA